MAISTMPKPYRRFSEWIFAAHKHAPEAVEEKLEIAGKGGKKIRVVRMAPSDASPKGFTYASYFVDLKVPMVIELGFRAEDPRRADYEKTARALIAELAF
jgi:hypothetical protein